MAQTISVKDVSDLEQKFLELAHISIKLRRAQHHERSTNLRPAKQIRIYWENRMDNFLNSLNVVNEHKELCQIKLQFEEKKAES